MDDTSSTNIANDRARLGSSLRLDENQTVISGMTTDTSSHRNHEAASAASSGLAGAAARATAARTEAVAALSVAKATGPTAAWGGKAMAEPALATLAVSSEEAARAPYLAPATV